MYVHCTWEYVLCKTLRLEIHSINTQRSSLRKSKCYSNFTLRVNAFALLKDIKKKRSKWRISVHRCFVRVVCFYFEWACIALPWFRNCRRFAASYANEKDNCQQNKELSVKRNWGVLIIKFHSQKFGCNFLFFHLLFFFDVRSSIAVIPVLSDAWSIS